MYCYYYLYYIYHRVVPSNNKVVLGPKRCLFLSASPLFVIFIRKNLSKTSSHVAFFGRSLRVKTIFLLRFLTERERVRDVSEERGNNPGSFVAYTRRAETERSVQSFLRRRARHRERERERGTPNNKFLFFFFGKTRISCVLP